MVIMCRPAAMSLCLLLCKRENRADHRRDAGGRDADQLRYTLCGEEVQMHGGVVRTASGGLAGSTLC